MKGIKETTCFKGRLNVKSMYMCFESIKKCEIKKILNLISRTFINSVVDKLVVICEYSQCQY